MEVACSSDTWAALSNSTWCQHPKQDEHLTVYAVPWTVGSCPWWCVRRWRTAGLDRIVGLDSDTAVLPRASHTSLPCCIPSRGYTPAGHLRGSVQTMADFQIHSKQKLFPPFNSMVTPCCLVHCFGEMSRLHFQARNAVRTGKKLIQIQRDNAVVTTEFPQNRNLSTKLHGVTPQETIILIWVTCNICNRLYFVYSCGLYGILFCCGVPTASVTVFLLRKNVFRRLSWHHLHCFLQTWSCF